MTDKRSYSLAEVAADYLPDDWKDPQRWLQRHLAARQIGGYKVGNTWRMTAADVENMIARHHNQITETGGEPVDYVPAGILDGLSPRSRRRLKSA